MKTNTKTTLLFAAILSLLSSCTELTPEVAKQAVITGEQERLDYLIQTINAHRFMSPEIHSITLDSIALTNDVEPMSGFIYSTWTVGTKHEVKNILILVDSIIQYPDNKDLVQWHAHWDEAYRAATN